LVVVSTEVLPEIFTKVIEAKRMLACGEEKSSASVCKKIGISRSAFYKYKDFVFAYNEKLTQKIISLYIILKDEPGVLANVLTRLHAHGANILTVNQNIPIDGVAAVTITVRLDGETIESFDAEALLSGLFGVVEVRFISGE
jgi:chorismate mutase